MIFLDMLKSKHTPGPWFPSYRGGALCSMTLPFPHVRGAEDAQYYGGYLICESCSTKADTALMAHAPNMYDLLLSIHDWLAVSAVSGQAVARQEEICKLLCDIHLMGERQ